MRSSRRVLFTLCALTAITPAVASATIISAGYDPLETRQPTFVDFISTPIPQNFFDPGSDPFDGVVQLEGLPLGSFPVCPGVNLGQVDTIVERKLSASLPNIGDSSTVPIEIMALSLTSVDPITVTYGGSNPELWKVDVTLPSSQPALGQMTITRTHTNGGSFTAAFRVQPRFTFTRVVDDAIRVLDGMIIIDFSSSGCDWVHVTTRFQCGFSYLDFRMPGTVQVQSQHRVALPTCSPTNFIPGINGISGEIIVAWSNYAPNAVLTVAPVCEQPIGTKSASWGAVKALYRE